MGAGDVAVRAWERESFEQFWMAAKDKASADLLKTLDPGEEIYFRLDSVHVALEIYRGLGGVFVNLSVGDGRAFWVRDLALWLKARGFRRLYWCAETQTWGRVLVARYKKHGIRVDPVVGRPGWSNYEINLDQI